jgi:peptide/nickel transport system permease protein
MPHERPEKVEHMARFVVRRLIYSVVVLLTVTMFVFAMSHLSGDPRTVYLNEYVTQEQYDAWGVRMGLDKPLVVQYAVWLGKVVRGDFGTSLNENRPVRDVVFNRIPATLQLTAGAFVFAILFAVPLGVLSAVKRGTIWDYTGRSLALLGQATPPFWAGIMLILVFAVWLGWLPVAGRGGPSHYILPVITLGSGSAAGLLRLVRSSMLEVMDSEYIQFARAKGVANRSLIWKHAFRNAGLAPLTFAGLMLAGYLTGTVVTETVFAWPGLGRLAVSAVFNTDFAVLTAAIFLFTLIYVGSTFIIDIIYVYLDPRIVYS